jgi:putative Mg2+ transporter-C (MgtC) family protein
MPAINKSPSFLQVSRAKRPQPHHPLWSGKQQFSYFTDFTYSKGLFYALVLVYVVGVCVVVLLELVLSDAAIACDTTQLTEQQRIAVETVYTNPSFHYNPCRYMRLPRLLWLTREECSFGRRLLASVLLGGIVGWERRQADRPAGIRTMSLVSLGACLFGINSVFGFLDGPMEWDASRVSAAIPSGVGFLGAGLIFKENEKDKATGDTTHVVHGLTTAASLWIVSYTGLKHLDVCE